MGQKLEGVFFATAQCLQKYPSIHPISKPGGQEKGMKEAEDEKRNQGQKRTKHLSINRSENEWSRCHVEKKVPVIAFNNELV